MAHHGLWGWADLDALAARTSRSIKGSLLRAQEQYYRWLVFKDSRSDATIASDEGWSEDHVTLARLALEKVNELHDFANDIAGSQGDRLTAMRDAVFSFTGSVLVGQVKADLRSLIEALIAGDEGFSEFKSMAGADSDATIATNLESPATAALVSDCKAALRSANQMFEFANNNSSFGGQRDRFEDWRVLT